MASTTDFIGSITPSMIVRQYARALLSALFICAAPLHSADAMSGLITDFVEASSERVEALAPRLRAAYPQAHFLISGFSSPLGEWAFIRVEDANSCENDLCPTVVILEKTEWKVLVVAKKQVEISSSLENGGAITCKLISKDGLEIIFRYANGDKILYVAK
jgi:hypothetical protein